MADSQKKPKSLLDMAMQRLRGPANTDPKEAENKALSFSRGALGNTGAGSKIAGGLLDATRNPDNEYAGSTADTLDKSESEASRKYPTTNRIGSEAVATPAAALASEALPAAGLAGRALSQGAIGAAHGAYTAPGGQDRLHSAASGAAAGAALPLATSAAQALGSRLASLQPPAGPPPALAAAGELPPPPMSAGPSQQPSNIMMREPGAGPELPGPRAVRGMPTVPPDAAPEAAQQMVRSERDRLRIRPPVSEEALDESMIGGFPRDPKLPLEATGKYRVNDGPMDLQPHENDAQWAVREAEQNALARQARGLPPGNSAVPTAPRGNSLFAAEMQEPSTRSAMPTMPADYAKASPSARPTEMDFHLPDELASEYKTLPQGSLSSRLSSLQPPELQSVPPLSNAPTVMPGGLVSEIPKSPKPLVRESRIPAAERQAEAADVAHGNKMLGKDVSDADKRALEKSREGMNAENTAASRQKTNKPGKKNRK